MTQQDFCYWLQGFFELMKPAELSQEQVYQVREHLNLVEHKTGFCAWLMGALEFAPNYLNSEQTQKIEQNLKKEFELVIDVQVSPQDHNNLLKLHNNFPDSHQVRC